MTPLRKAAARRVLRSFLTDRLRRETPRVSQSVRRFMSDPTDIETEARGGGSGDFLPFGCVKITFKK
jgi:hypothetical protein